MGRFVLAKNDAMDALELQPTSFKAHRTLARVQLALGFLEEALTEFELALNACVSEAESASILPELANAQSALDGLNVQTYYELLGVTRDATSADITKAYRKASLVYHHDKVRKSTTWYRPLVSTKSLACV